jgi:S1-C subfamily serine protease
MAMSAGLSLASLFATRIALATPETTKDSIVQTNNDQEFYDQVAKSTLQVISGQSLGSGFAFRRRDICITNFHVVENAANSGSTVIARNTEFNQERSATIIGQSKEQDYAILRLATPLLETMSPFDAEPPGGIQRGSEIAFAGYPHGQPPLLVNKAWVSSLVETDGFVIGGNINAGNSGGPVVSRSTGKVVGIASARRFIGGPQMQEIKAQQDKLIAYLRSIAGHGSVAIMGIDFGSFAQVMAESLDIMQETMILNANTGIGIVRAIGPVVSAYESLKI